MLSTYTRHAAKYLRPLMKFSTQAPTVIIKIIANGYEKTFAAKDHNNAAFYLTTEAPKLLASVLPEGTEITSSLKVLGDSMNDHSNSNN